MESSARSDSRSVVLLTADLNLPAMTASRLGISSPAAGGGTSVDVESLLAELEKLKLDNDNTRARASTARMRAAGGELLELANGAARVNTEISEARSSLDAMEKELKALEGEKNSIIDSIKAAFSAAIDGVVYAAKKVWEGIEWLGNKIADAAKWLGDQILNGLKKIGSFFSGLFGGKKSSKTDEKAVDAKKAEKQELETQKKTKEQEYRQLQAEKAALETQRDQQIYSSTEGINRSISELKQLISETKTRISSLEKEYERLTSAYEALDKETGNTVREQVSRLKSQILAESFLFALDDLGDDKLREKRAENAKAAGDPEETTSAEAPDGALDQSAQLQGQMLAFSVVSVVRALSFLATEAAAEPQSSRARLSI
ncbi:hypothetical protein ACUSIJ_07545 [Pseudochelatococcus sp. B33]